MLLSLVSVCLLVLVLIICYLILFDSLTFSFLKRTLMVSYSAFLQTPLNGDAQLKSERWQVGVGRSITVKVSVGV